MIYITAGFEKRLKEEFVGLKHFGDSEKGFAKVFWGFWVIFQCFDQTFLCCIDSLLLIMKVQRLSKKYLWEKYVFVWFIERNKAWKLSILEI